MLPLGQNNAKTPILFLLLVAFSSLASLHKANLDSHFLTRFRRSLRRWNISDEGKCGLSYLNMKIGQFPCMNNRNNERWSSVDEEAGLFPVNPAKRILGKVVVPSLFPSMVSLLCTNKEGKRFLCGGTLVSDELVMTATHCVREMIGCVIKSGFIRYPQDPRNPIEYMNSTSYAWGYCMLPKYSDGTQGPHNDVAMVQLTEKLAFTETIQPACIKPSKKPLDGALCFAVGFNTSAINQGKRQFLYSQVRRGCSLPDAKKLDLEGRSCFELVSFGEKTCPGDSGMGLFCMDLCPGMSRARQYLVGVNSFGPKMEPGECEANTTSFNFYSDLFKLQTEVDIMLKYCYEFH